MQDKGFFTPRKAAALCLVLLMVVQQVRAGPAVSRVQPSDPRTHVQQRVHAPRRIARMTPLWRIMNSKPFGAYCQNNYECSTGICRGGHCSTNHRSPSEPVNY